MAIDSRRTNSSWKDKAGPDDLSIDLLYAPIFRIVSDVHG